MIGRTEKEVDANGQEVVALTENEALTLIEEYKKSYPEISEEESSLFGPGKKNKKRQQTKRVKSLGGSSKGSRGSRGRP